MITDLATVASTQDVAGERHAADGAPSLVVTGNQTGGRGRSGRTWLQADRGVAASLAVSPRWNHESWGLIPLATGVAVRAAVVELTGVDVGLKWPNDLVTSAGKTGGILAEASGSTVVIGCGLNLWWPEPTDGAAGLLVDDPGPDLGRSIAARWATRLLDILEAPATDWPRSEYLAASVTIGNGVSWEGGSGMATGIAPDGGLVVETASGPVTVHSGEVHLLR